MSVDPWSLFFVGLSVFANCVLVRLLIRRLRAGRRAQRLETR